MEQEYEIFPHPKIKTKRRDVLIVRSNDLLCCPFCDGKATLIKNQEDSYWPRDMVTCKNEECELTDWIPFDDWQRRAT